MTCGTAFLIFVTLATAVSSAFCQGFADCGVTKLHHKLPSEVAAMTADQKMEQMVLEVMFHPPTNDDENHGLLHDHLVKDSTDVLPKAIEYLQTYDPTETKCRSRSEARVLTAVIYAGAVDGSTIRLRSIESGRTFLRLLEALVERRQSIHDDTRNRLLGTHLKQMQGISIKDGMIREALAKQFKVEMSEAELRNFCEHLILVDSTYPSWTQIVGWAPEMPPDEARRYYEAYLKFKKTRS